MRDPYLYEDVPVLKNLLGIKDAELLECAEADITSIRLLIVDGVIQSPIFDFSRLLLLHKHIFGDIFAWAGQVRVVPIIKGERVLGGDTVRYSQPDSIEADYVIGLKGNQGNLFEDVKLHFESEESQVLTETPEKGHGRIEQGIIFWKQT